MKRLLFLTNHPFEDGSCRYRVYQFLPYLESIGFQCKVRPFSSPRLFRAIRKKGNFVDKSWETVWCSIRRLVDLWSLSSFDVVVIHREVFPFFMPAVERLFLRCHKNVVFSYDDAIYAGHSDNDSLNHKFLYRFKYGPGVKGVLSRCAWIIAGNKTLAAYARHYNKNVSVIPTVVDLDQYQYLEKETETGDLITIGWFGSQSTSSYLKTIEPALKDVARRHQNISFLFVGDPGLKIDLPNVEIKPFSLDTELDDLRRMDIGLMPMPDTTWTRGKCSFKAIQYMALGIPAVVSPIGMAEDLVRHRQNGFHAATITEWVGVLDELACTPHLRKQIGFEARKTVEQSYSLQVWAPRLAELFWEL